MHLEQLPSGTWRVTVQHGGRRKRGTARTRSEAQMVGARLLAELGGDIADHSVTVADLLHVVLADKAATVSPRTHEDWRRVARRVPADFLARKVAAVNPPHVDALYRRLAVDGWTAHRVQRLHGLLSIAWAHALRYQWANLNPYEYASPPKPAAPEIHPPSDEQVRRLIAAADPRFATYLRLSATSGARRGELVALQWADIDLDGGAMLIARSFVEADGTVHLRATKTGAKGHRRIALGAGVLGSLRAHRVDQLEGALRERLPPPKWVFSHDYGCTPWRPDYATHAFGKLCKRVDVTGVRLHDLRHYVATTLLAGGESPHVVAGRLGHSTSATTQRTYAHFLPEQDRSAADTLDARLG